MCHKDISCFRTCSVIFKFCVRVKSMRTYVDSNVKKKSCITVYEASVVCYFRNTCNNKNYVYEII